MLKKLLQYNDASLIYLCNGYQLITQIKNEQLTKEDLERLKNVFEIHCDKSALFVFMLEQQINLKKDLVLNKTSMK